VIFLAKAVQGDFGPSYVYKNRTVQEIIRQAFPVSLHLGGMALVVALVGGLTLGRRVMLVHVVKNAMIPVLTIVGPLFAGIGTGSFFVETIYRVPGLGRFFVESMTGRDYPMIMAVVLLYGAFLALMNLLVDLLYGVLDPRIRYA